MMDLINKAFVVNDGDGRKQLLDRLSTKQESAVIVSWLNAHSFSVAQQDAILHDSLLRSTYLLRDGIGMALLMALTGKARGKNMNGTDFIPEILRRFKGRKVALFGTEEPHISRAAAVAESMGVAVVSYMDGFQPDHAYAAALETADAELIVLGMGVPKQEKVSLLLAQNLKKPAVILNGGAILDFMAGRFPRAPRLVRKMRMEWLFRLLHEPGRLWQRYIGSLPELAGHAWKLHCAAKNPQNRTTPHV